MSLSATPSVAEGGSIVYSATLTSAAQTAVTVSLANSATITIAAGAGSGTVSARAPSDDVYVDAGSVSTSIVTASRWKLREPGGQRRAGDHDDHRHGGREHSEPHRVGQRGRGWLYRLHGVAEQRGAIAGDA